MKKLHASALTASFLVAGSFATYASPAFASQPEKTSVVIAQPATAHEIGNCETPDIKTTASGNITESLDESTRIALNSLFAQNGGKQIPQGAVRIETTPSGNLIAFDASDNRVATLDLSPSTHQKKSPLTGVDASTASAGSWLKGAARGFAKAVAGCVGGVIGYDAILGVLEKRVSYWAFVKWLGGKVGWALAVSCAAGAATAVLGW